MDGDNPKIDIAACEQLAASAQSCPAIIVEAASYPILAPEPHWDALANSFASLSAAFAWGSILLALIAILGAVTWGIVVKTWAEKSAKEEAADCVKKLMDQWLRDEAPKIVRTHVENLGNTSLGTISDSEAADRIGREAG